MEFGKIYRLVKFPVLDEGDCRFETKITMIIKRVTNRFGTVLPQRTSAKLHLVQSSRFARRLAKWMLIGLILAFVGMAFLPWQQTSRGTGQVIAYDPQERPQAVQSPVKGVVKWVAPGIFEGVEVKKDQLILEIEPVASNQVEQIKSQIRELENQVKTAETTAEIHQQNKEEFTQMLVSAMKAADDQVAAAKEKVASKQNLIPSYESKVKRTKLQYDRQKTLSTEGAVAGKEFEKWENEWEIAKAELQSIKTEIKALEKERSAKENEREAKRREGTAKINEAETKRQKALGDVNKIRKEITDLETKSDELKRNKIRAPRDGKIYRFPVYTEGQAVKESQDLFTVVPDVTDIAVELFVVGNDMPLVQVGQEVRLQFEGWPAVQFAGWPSVAIGTFSGRVVNVDPTDNGKGQFRILIKPSIDSDPWPSERFLRQGVRTNGWVMLRQVSLGYEIWRQLNGFPVIVSDKEPGKGGSKVPKLPK